jgi:hypothetical protein
MVFPRRLPSGWKMADSGGSKIAAKCCKSTYMFCVSCFSSYRSLSSALALRKLRGDKSRRVTMTAWQTRSWLPTFSTRPPSLPQQTNDRETLQHLRLRLHSAGETPHSRLRRFCDRAIPAHGLAGVYDFLLFGFAFCKRQSRSKRCGVGRQREDCTHRNGLNSGWRIHFGYR